MLRNTKWMRAGALTLVLVVGCGDEGDLEQEGLDESSSPTSAPEEPGTGEADESTSPVSAPEERDASEPDVPPADGVEVRETDARSPTPAVAPQVAHAAQELARRVLDSADPKGAYEALSVPDRAAFDSVTIPATEEAASTVEPSGDTVAEDEADEPTDGLALAKKVGRSGCFSVSRTGKAKARAGNTLFTYWQTTRVCAKRGRVTSIKVTNAGGETSTPGWRIDRRPTTQVKSVGWEGRSVARYYFVLGVGGWDVQRPSRCIQLRLNANLRDRRILTHCNIDR